MSLRNGGARPWIAQRLTAAYMAIYLVLFFIFAFTQSAFDFQNWQALFQSPLMNTATILFWMSLLWHAWIGMRDVAMDYVSHDGVRFVTLSLIGFYLLFLAVWALKILLPMKGVL